jgi:hypothetical protein
MHATRAYRRGVRIARGAGLPSNGTFPKVDLPAYASTEDIVATAVNRTILGSKA